MSFLWGAAKPVFDAAKQMPPVEGKIVMVTGGTSGLGKQAVLEFARYKPKKIWLAARNATAAEKAIQDIRKEVPDAPIQFLHLDLTSFASISKAAQTFNQESERLDILMQNAGIVATAPGLTEDGYEIQFGVNYLGTVLLTRLLLPTLLKSAELSGADIRIVFLGSAASAMAPSEGIILDTVKTKVQEQGTWTRYAQSKLAIILYARELAKRHTKIMITAVDPGFVDTNWAQSFKTSSFIMGWLYPLMRTAATGVETGVQNQLWASVSSDTTSGTYYTPVGVPGTAGNLSNDVLAAKLWDWTEAELAAVQKS